MYDIVLKDIVFSVYDITSDHHRNLRAPPGFASPFPLTAGAVM